MLPAAFLKSGELMFSSVEMILKKWSESGEMSSKKKRNWINISFEKG